MSRKPKGHPSYPGVTDTSKFFKYTDHLSSPARDLAEVANRKKTDFDEISSRRFEPVFVRRRVSSGSINWRRLSSKVSRVHILSLNPHFVVHVFLFLIFGFIHVVVVSRLPSWLVIVPLDIVFVNFHMALGGMHLRQSRL